MKHFLSPLLGLLPLVASLGINCRGSGDCPLASFENTANEGVMQGLRDALYVSTADPNTLYHSGDHVICVSTSIAISLGYKFVTLSGNVQVGGVCVFPQDLAAPLSLAQIRPLADALLTHGCTTCGSVPVHFVDKGSNDPGQGILTFNFVAKPVCVGTCLGVNVGNGGVIVATQTTANVPTVVTQTIVNSPDTATFQTATTAAQQTTMDQGPTTEQETTTVHQTTVQQTTIQQTAVQQTTVQQTTPSTTVNTPASTTTTAAPATVTVHTGAGHIPKTQHRIVNLLLLLVSNMWLW